MDQDITTTTDAPMEVVSDDVPAWGDEEPARSGGFRWGRWLSVGAWVVVGLVLVAGAVLSQTRAGQRLVIDKVLEIARGALAGELAVDEVRSRTLLTGVTLSGVRLDAAEGRRFLTADSVVARYSPVSLLLGSPRLRSTTIYGLDLEISRYPGDDFLNVGRLLAERGPVPDSAGVSRPQTIGLGRVSVRGGVIEVLTPAEVGDPGTPIPAPNGGALRRVAFDLEDLDLEETVLRPGGSVVVDARLASLTASIFLLERPLVIREAFGRLSFGARGLEVTEAAFRLPGTLSSGTVSFGPDRPGGAWAFSADLSTDGWGELADI